MLKIKCGDKVVVIAGKDKGKEGTVLKVLSNSDNSKFKLKVEGVNIVKKAKKGNPKKGVTGGILESEAFIHYSNVQIINSINGKADKVGFKILETGKKVRIFKSNKEVIANG